MENEYGIPINTENMKPSFIKQIIHKNGLILNLTYHELVKKIEETNYGYLFPSEYEIDASSFIS